MKFIREIKNYYKSPNILRKIEVFYKLSNKSRDIKYISNDRYILEVLNFLISKGETDILIYISEITLKFNLCDF